MFYRLIWQKMDVSTECHNDTKYHTPKTAQMPQTQTQSADDSPHPSSVANLYHREVAYSGNLSECVNTLRRQRRDAKAKQIHQLFPTPLAYDKWELKRQIQVSCPNFGQTNLSSLQNLMILGHCAVAKLAYRQALTALRQAYQTQSAVSARQALDMVGWYRVFCVLAYHLYPNAYQYSPIIKAFKQKINQHP